MSGRDFLHRLGSLRAGLLVFGLALCAMPLRPLLAETHAAPAITDPALAVGLSGITDWSTQHAFIDLMKTARGWTGHLRGQFGGFEYDALRADGFLDEHGWPRALPPGVVALESFVLTDQPAAAQGLAGRYVLTYDGTARVQVAGAVSNRRYGQNEIRFDFRPGDGSVSIRIDRIDPGRTGDYPRNIRLMREDHVPLDKLGLIFNPDWLRHVRDMRVLRFMEWMSTNNSLQVTWQDRPHPADATYHYYVRGVPVEVMVALANEVGADAWFTMPHMADDDYVRRFATYVRDHLRPGLKAYVEYSNEVWNWQFAQATYAGEQAAARWGDDVGDGWMQYAGLRAAQVADIWTDIFADQAAERLVRVIATQTGWLGLEEGLLNAPAWLAEDPAHRPPYKSFDAYAITAYFGVEGDADDSSRRILGWLDAGQDVATANLLDELRRTSVPALTEVQFPHHAAVAQQHGLDLIIYEGGSHVVGLNDWTGNDRLTSFFTTFNYDPGVAAIYDEILTAWHAAGGTLFNAFVDVQAPSRWGSWGHLRHLDDSNPRWDVLMAYNAQTPVTWETRVQGTFDNGIIRRASSDGGTILARHPQDVLLGGPGDDILIAAGCCNRIFGGGGQDVAVVPGRRDDYALTWEGDVLLIRTIRPGMQGGIRLLDVQKLRFSDQPEGEITLVPGAYP
jgi:hypothetical protein